MVKDIVYGREFLEQEHRINSKETPTISKAIFLGQKICLQGYVICYWRLEEEIEEMYTLSFCFKKAVLTQNLKGGYSYYQVQKNSDGNPMLVRVPESFTLKETQNMVKKLYFMKLKRCDKNSARYKVIRKNTTPIILNEEDEVLVKGGIIHEHTFQDCADGCYKLYVKCHKMRKISDATLYQVKVNTAGKPELIRV